MREAVGQSMWYGDPEALELREALAALHGCGVRNISVGAGIDDLLGLAVRAYLAPGDVTVATLGSYPTYVYHVIGYGASLETVPYADDGSLQLDALAERAHATGARIAYLANPDNPSGAFAGREAVAHFIDALPEDCLVLLDEAYGDFVAPADLLADTIDPRVVRMRTFSKAFGLAGARIGYCLGSAETIETFNKIRLQFNVNRIAQSGALAALGERDFVAGVVAEVARGRDDYAALAARFGLRTLASRTNFVCIDLGSRAAAEAMVEQLLRCGIFIRKPGLPPLDRYVRVTVGTPAQRQELAAAFGAALETVRATGTVLEAAPKR